MSNVLKSKELLTLSVDELNQNLHSYKKNLFEARFNKFAGADKNTSIFRKYKRAIARVCTRLQELQNK